ncbi:MAG TPA: hypothetical protein VGW10_15195 [Solirubrobacteraceae bacterium]|nr:hypothetical protein [Solirubrobacteraceae bacterium]
MALRILAGLLALNRVAVGARYLTQPKAAGSTWIGRRASRRPATQVFVRAQGARDVALGAGALAALTGGTASSSRTWMAAHALADGADLAATLAVKDRLPKRRSTFAATVAGASLAVAAAAAAGLRDD